jgi:hypothetical protein
LAKNAKSQKTTNPNIGLWVPKDADFFVDFKNINYFSENCIYQKFFQYNIKIIFKNVFLNNFLGAFCQ